MSTDQYLSQTEWWADRPLLPLHPNSSLTIVGPTCSGKSWWTARFLKEARVMYEKDPPAKILFCHARGVWQSLYDQMESTVQGIEFHEGLPTAAMLEELSANDRHNIVVLDDLMHEVTRSTDCELLFTQYCHHKRFSVLFLTQNAFRAGKNARTIALNTHYLVLFKNMRDELQIRCLARQMFPGHTDYFMKAYNDATSVPFGYLLIDNFPGTDPRYRVRTHVFPNEDTVVYEKT